MSDNFQVELKAILNDDIGKALQNQLTEISKKLSISISKINFDNTTIQKSLEGIKITPVVDAEKVKSELSNLTKVVGESVKYKVEFDVNGKEITTATDRVIKFQDALGNTERVLHKLKDSANGTGKELTIVGREFNNSFDPSKFSMKLNEATSKIQLFGTKHSEVFSRFPEYKQRYDALVSEFQKNQTPQGLTKVNSELKILENNMKSANSGSQSFFSSLGNGAKQALGVGSAMMIAYKAIQLIVEKMKEAVDVVIKLDNQMTNIRMVTGDNEQQTIKLMQSYQQLAREVSSTTLEVAKSAEEWLRQGRTLSETNDLIKTSQIFSKVGALEGVEAAELLTSSINGYGVAVEDAMSIVDKMSAIDVEAATSTKELAKALAETATSAKLAGVDMDTALSYIATISETTRDSAESIGNSLKTIFARIQQVKLGKLEVDGEDVSNVETVLKQYNIALRDSQGLFRDTSVVLEELNQKWKTLESTQKSEIAEQFAGVRQKEKFLVLMENFDRALGLQAVAYDSAGSAMNKFNIYQDSTQAKMDELKNEFQVLSSQIIDSDLVKFVIDSGTEITKTIQSIISVLNTPVGKAGLIAILSGLNIPNGPYVQNSKCA